MRTTKQHAGWCHDWGSLGGYERVDWVDDKRYILCLGEPTFYTPTRPPTRDPTRGGKAVRGKDGAHGLTTSMSTARA